MDVEYLEGGYSSICWRPRFGWQEDSGYYRFGASKQYVHRLFFEQYVATVPDGMVIDHLCRNRWCCSPDHLEPVSNEENIARGDLPIMATESRCVHGLRQWRKRCPPCRREYRIEVGETKSRRGPAADRVTCPYGHPYSEENTYLVRRADGSVKQRMCRECGRQRVRARRAGGKR